MLSRKTIVAILVYTLPFEVLFLPGLPLRMSVHLVAAFIFATLLLMYNPKINTDATLWIGILVPYLFASVLLAAIYFPNELYSVMPDDYGIRGSKYRGLYQIVYWLLSVLTFLVLLKLLRSSRSIEAALNCLIKVSIAVCIFSIIELAVRSLGYQLYYPRYPEPGYTPGANVNGIPRLYSVFEEPGTFGRFLGIVIIISFTMKSAHSGQFCVFRSPKLLYVLLFIVSLFLTFSLSSILCLVLVIFTKFIFSLKHKHANYWSTVVTLVFFGACAALFTQFFGDFVMKKITALLEVTSVTEATSATVRLYGQILAVETFMNFPLFGVGFGNEMFFTYMPSVSKLTFGAHNFLLTLLLELGIFGALLYGYPFIINLFLQIDIRNKKHPVMLITRAAKWGLFYSLLHHVLFGAARFTAMDWFLLALISSSYTVAALSGRNNVNENTNDNRCN